MKAASQKLVIGMGTNPDREHGRRPIRYAGAQLADLW